MIAGLGIVLVALAGGVGAVVRFALARLGHPDRLPWPILVANLAGAFVAGLATSVLGGEPLLLLVVVTGFCGGLTTFSTWMVETVQLADRRRMRAAVANVAVTLVAGVALAAVGLWLGALLAA
ncbi:fluoride efflux transporter FluC [Agrococcus jejuensis]|uniref:fluoride efflux transporter FluC n=1 Tax=Agrococcus jejuensis TaxID=399736 RepID=UPI00119D0862|nr:CrcB family protein [Agrococcus jejuensis]